MRIETQKTINNYYDTQSTKKLLRFAKIIEKEYQNREIQREIWKYDQSIGGLGGYAAPLNPVSNPFNSMGDYRNVFRSLQYARSDMFYCMRPRHIIIDSALHIETLVKLAISNNKIMKFIYNHRELGKNISLLYKERIIDDTLYERLDFLRRVLNYAKHDTDPNRDNTFDYEDAIIFYFECRYVGNELLKILKHNTCGQIYEIHE